MFRVIGNTDDEFVFSTHSTVVFVFETLCIFYRIRLRICPSIEKKIRAISNFHIRGLRLMLDGLFILSTPFIPVKQFATLCKCYRHTVDVHVPFYKIKEKMTHLLLIRTFPKYF